MKSKMPNSAVAEDFIERLHAACGMKAGSPPTDPQCGRDLSVAISDSGERAQSPEL
jgi:hypothetical protein